MKLFKKLIALLGAASMMLSAMPVMANAAVSVTGTLKPGYTLTASCVGADAYAWYRVAEDGTETLIDGATEATYTLVNADGTSKIKVVASKDGEELANILTEDIAAGFGPTSGRDSNILAQNGDNKYKFTIAETGEKFILLDTTSDADGKFFVLANKSYGSYQFDFSGKTSAASQKFDPEDTTNIAYWLNNDFIANGNNGSKMSDVILEKDENGDYKYLDADHEWLTEAGMSTGKCPDDYVVKSALALISRQELMQHKDKIGYQDGCANYWWLRTGRATGNNAVFVGHWSEKGTHSNPAYMSGPVRPVLYLNDEFFKNVKLDLANTGSEVYTAIKATCAKSDLTDKYTEEELVNILGYEAAVQKELKITDLSITGTMKPGYTLTASAKWSEENATLEGRYEYQWYTCETSDGEGTAIEGETAATYVLRNADTGKYIRCAITPFDKNGDFGTAEGVTTTETVAAGFGPTSERDSNILAQNGDNKYKFTIAETGEKFILLDTTSDADGKFFVLADKSYGSYQFDFSGKATAASQKFDPEDTTNIAYWLNNDFVANGNPVKDTEGTVTAENKMSDVILEKDENGDYKYLDADHEWLTEAGMSTGKCPNDYIVKSALAFLSRQELLQYKDKIGYQDGCANYWWLRTGRASENNAVFVCFWSEKGTHSVEAYKSNPVRPVLYLNDEFFKNVKLDLANTGSEVLTALTLQYGKEELRRVYTEEEVETYFDYNDIKVLSFEYKDADGNELTSVNEAKGKITVSAEIMGATDTTVYMINAIYGENGRLKKVVYVDTSITKGEKKPIEDDVELNDITIEENDYINTFFWKDIAELKPLCDNFSKKKLN